MCEISKPKAKLPDPVEVDMKLSRYRPTTADRNEEIDMPGWSLERIRETFFRPFRIKEAE